MNGLKEKLNEICQATNKLMNWLDTQITFGHFKSLPPLRVSDNFYHLMCTHLKNTVRTNLAGLSLKIQQQKNEWPKFCSSSELFLFIYLYRKRAAEQKIKNYFFQLTDGCGVQGCSNEYCASSGRKQTSKDDAAALALQLFMKKARLCEPLQEKNHKGTYSVYTYSKNNIVQSCAVVCVTSLSNITVVVFSYLF